MSGENEFRDSLVELIGLEEDLGVEKSRDNYSNSITRSIYICGVDFTVELHYPSYGDLD